jgi:hypothetical protein
MDMIDLGNKSPDVPTGQPVEVKKKKITYPSLTIDKDMGMKMGQKVMMEGRVSGIRKDNYGDSTTIECIKCGSKESISDDEYSKLSDDEKDKADKESFDEKMKEDDTEE